MRVDLKFGRSWGDAKHTWEELTAAALTPTDAAVRCRSPNRNEHRRINGAKVHAATAQAPIELPQISAEGNDSPVTRRLDR